MPSAPRPFSPRTRSSAWSDTRQTLIGTDYKREVDETLRVLKARGVFETIDSLAPSTTAEQLGLCEIPAPPFGEARRAQHLRDRLQELCGVQTSFDEEGNVIGVIGGVQPKPVVIVSAHLDTVFPEGSDVRVRVHGRRLHAPGISDNASGLVVLLTLARVIREHGLRPSGTLVLLGSVGEEAHGNLRGVRHFFTRSQWVQHHGVDAFMALDGHGLERIVHRGLGSRRFRVQMTGPGGHSWGDFGLVNPIHAIAYLVVELSQCPFSDQPRSSLNVGTVWGGRSVNAIPQSASVDVDMRSTDASEIDRLERYLRRAAEKAVSQELRRASDEAGRIQVQIELLGERPAGEVPPDSRLLHVAAEATRAFGVEPVWECASTDANIPISVGIPAIALGSGGLSGGVHTLHEWYDPCTRETGIKRALLAALALTSLAESVA